MVLVLPRRLVVAQKRQQLPLVQLRPRRLRQKRAPPTRPDRGVDLCDQLRGQYNVRSLCAHNLSHSQCDIPVALCPSSYDPCRHSATSTHFVILAQPHHAVILAQPHHVVILAQPESPYWLLPCQLSRADQGPTKNPVKALVLPNLS